MKNVYKVNGLPFWNANEIAEREHLVRVFPLYLEEFLRTENAAWHSHRIEAPVLTPHDHINPNYTDQDVCKVYDRHIENGEPHKAYFEWAVRGWLSDEAHRYPMGKGAKPEYSYWDGQKLSYVEARKKIYAPLYAGAVEHTDAFKRLKEIYEAEKEIWLWDFDAYDHHKLGMTYEQVINSETRKMGHCFVLGMLLENQRVWE
jgi:hypothetical protein